jgi:hypothetical protein
MRADVDERLLAAEVPTVEEFVVGRQRAQEVGVRAVRQERDLRRRNASALEVLDEPVGDRRDLPGMPQEKVLEPRHEREHRLVAQEAELARDVDLQVGDVVDVRHAAQPLHQDGHEAERERLRLDEDPVGLRVGQRSEQCGGSEAEVVRQPQRG